MLFNHRCVYQNRFNIREYKKQMISWSKCHITATGSWYWHISTNHWHNVTMFQENSFTKKTKMERTDINCHQSSAGTANERLNKVSSSEPFIDPYGVSVIQYGTSSDEQLRYHSQNGSHENQSSIHQKKTDHCQVLNLQNYVQTLWNSPLTSDIWILISNNRMNTMEQYIYLLLCACILWTIYTRMKERMIESKSIPNLQ